SEIDRAFLRITFLSSKPGHADPRSYILIQRKCYSNRQCPNGLFNRWLKVIGKSQVNIIVPSQFQSERERTVVNYPTFIKIGVSCKCFEFSDRSTYTNFDIRCDPRYWCPNPYFSTR